MNKKEQKSETRVFDAYASYYDLLYRDKDYAGEVAYVHKQLSRQRGVVGSLLELGCGTGRHAVEFLKLGYAVSGVDLSESMVQQAVERAARTVGGAKLDFRVGDVRTVRLRRKFDAVVALFHVMSYQTRNSDLEAAFQTAAGHLKPGGLFLFDFWYGPAVLSDPPAVRIKRMADEYRRIVRLAEPTVNHAANVVTVNYEIQVEMVGCQPAKKIWESHHMRYLFLPEINGHLAACGLMPLATGPWLGSEPLRKDAWCGWVLARKQS